MNEFLTLLIAAGCAAAMGILAKGGVERNLRSAIRTTLILAVGWGLAWVGRPANSPHTLSPRISALLCLSGLIVALGWILWLWSRQRPHTGGPALMDKLNVAFAAVFGVVAFYPRGDATAWMTVLLVVAGAFILTCNRS